MYIHTYTQHTKTSALPLSYTQQLPQQQPQQFLYSKSHCIKKSLSESFISHYYLRGEYLQNGWNFWVPDVPADVTKLTSLWKTLPQFLYTWLSFSVVFSPTESQSIGPGERKPFLLSVVISVCRTGVLTHHYCSFSRF